MSDGLGSETGGITRRRFVRNAGVLGVAAADALAAPAWGATRYGRRARRQSVAVFGGGVAGLTAAHELAERGFEVTVYERRAWGGKARSIDVPGTGTGGRRPLPAEHGFREVAANYQNLPDTMGRIPFGSNANGILGNLVDAPVELLTRARGLAPFVLPQTRDVLAVTPAEGLDALLAVFSWLAPSDLAHLVSRIAVFLSSGQARRYGELEYQSWAEFAQADRFTADGRTLFIDFLTRFAAQSKSGQTSARTLGMAAESTIYMPLTGRGVWRVLDAPTNEVWIDPWLAYLRGLGVQLRLGHQLTGLRVNDGRIVSATVQTGRQTADVNADWYLVALPVDWATRLWTAEILAADPALARSFNITAGWMVGLQMYLHEPTPFADGPLGCVDSPWAIGGISQAQFWRIRDFAADYGDGTVRDKFSAIIVDWDTPGILYGKPARACTQTEIAAETWAQLKAHFTYPGAPALPDSLLASTFLDPGISWRNGRIVGYDDPLPRSDPGTWDDRPEVAGAIENLFLAGDWLKVDFDISSMEGANEAARRAVNALLDRAASAQPRVQVFDRLLPAEWAALRTLDDDRYTRGLPNLFDAAGTPDAIQGLLNTLAAD